MGARGLKSTQPTNAAIPALIANLTGLVYRIAVNELGDINGNGCHQNSDLLLLEELIGGDPMAGPPENFFADLDQDGDIDCDDLNELQDLVHAEEYPGCVPRIVAQPATLEAAATFGAKGRTGIPLPIYLENDSSEVGSILCTMMYDPNVLRLDTLTLTQRTSGFSNAVPECRRAMLPPEEEEVLLSGTRRLK